MGNLGFQTVYELFDRADGVVCERAFLPDEDDARRSAAAALRTLESGRRVADCDLLAFSISFETDYLNVPRLLELAGLAPRRGARGADDPLVIAGGPAIFLNPEPIADFVDLFLIGEAEEMLPEFLGAVRGSTRRAAPSAPRCSTRRPSRSAARTSRRTSSRCSTGRSRARCAIAAPAPARVERRLIWDLNRFATTTRVLSDEAVFGDMVHGRGEPRLPVGLPLLRRRLHVPADPHARSGAARRRRRRRPGATAATIGLVGAEMASVPGVDRLSELRRRRAAAACRRRRSRPTASRRAWPPRWRRAARAASPSRPRPAPSACAG